MVGWHHQLDEHEFESTPGVGDGQGSLVCYSPWGRKESDTPERLNSTELNTCVSGIIQNLSFCDWLISLCIMSSRSISFVYLRQ